MSSSIAEGCGEQPRTHAAGCSSRSGMKDHRGFTGACREISCSACCFYMWLLPRMGQVTSHIGWLCGCPDQVN